MVWNDIGNLQGEACNGSSNNVYHTVLKLSTSFCLLDCETVFYVLLAPALVSSIYRSVSKPWLNKAFDGNH